jgi:DNA-directed RNA polymerase subunit RPC12/RpoP
VLSLKASPAKAPVWRWKCKPCGAALEIGAELADADAVRCPACNAKLGRAEQFRGDPPDAKVRARRVEAESTPAPAPTSMVVERRRLTSR